MTPKAYLSRYAAAERHIHYLEEQKERWHRRATRVTPQYGPAPGGGSGISKPVEDAFVQAMETEEEIAAEISKAAGLLREIRSAIDAVPDAVQREVLERRYIGMQSLEKIAVEMNYSYAHVLRLHGWALQQVVVPGNDARSC